MNRLSRLMFHWRSDLCSMNTVNGAAGVFARAATATGTDTPGGSYTAVNGQPNWSWYSNIPHLLLDSNDRLYFPFNALPRGMTLYAKFIEQGTIAIGAARLLEITNSSGAAPRLRMWIQTGAYALHHYNGTGGGATNVGVVLGTAPTDGQTVELVAQAASDGSVNLIQSINSATSTQTGFSAALTLASAWADTRMYVNQDGAGSNVGNNAFRCIKVAAGTQTLTTMRTAF
jgi:hypothetical protein